MNRLALPVIAALALAFMTPAALAEGFSVGGAIGTAKVKVDDPDVSFDGTDLGWKVYGKYMFSDNFGVELGYVNLGKPDDTIVELDIEVPIDIEATGFDVFLVGSIPASESFELFGKLGYIMWDAEISSPLVPEASESDDGEDLAAGIGAAFHTSDTFSIVGEWEWFDIADSDAVWMLSVGVAVGFN